MRYLIQIVMMVSDVLILTAIIYFAVYHGWEGILISLVFLILYFKSGGLMAWRTKNIKKFMENAKEMGL